MSDYDEVNILLDAFRAARFGVRPGRHDVHGRCDFRTTNTGQYKWPLPAGFAWVHGQDVTVSVKLPESSPATGAPEISGTPQVGETLTADTAGIVTRTG